MIAPTDLQSVGYCLPADCKSAGAREQGNDRSNGFAIRWLLFACRLQICRSKVAGSEQKSMFISLKYESNPITPFFSSDREAGIFGT